MSKKQWLALLMLFLFYLLLGATVFYHIESPLEQDKARVAKRERIEINALLNTHYVPGGGHDQHEILQKLTKYCGKSVHNYSEGEVDPLKWDFYNSFYFAYTVVSTIGYGNLAPTNMFSRVLMIFYALIGIPMNGILLAQLGEFFGQTFVTAVKKYKSYKQNQNEYSKKSLSSLENQRKFSLAMRIFMYLIPGFLLFIFFPAFLFSYYEGWTYDEAVYYAFVTLTTIGFGDYVAGQDNTKGEGLWFSTYKIFLIVWISFGLGYIVMIMKFIGLGMTSKRIARLEHKLAVKIKHTQSKIWNEVNEDMQFFRRVINELQFSKVKRVYVDEYDSETPPPHFPRSNSFPSLRELVYGGLEPPSPPCPRRRANSEVVPMESKVARVVSETDLQRIDKRATFASHAMVQPAELLARLVNILGYIPPPPDDDEPEPDKAGVLGFSEKDILASETPWNAGKPKWELGGDSPKPCRSRATSEVRLDRPDLLMQPSACEWTWSGPAASTKIQEMIRARRSAEKDRVAAAAAANADKTKFAISRKTLLPRWVRQLRKTSSAQEQPAITVDHVPYDDDDDDDEDGGSSSQPQTPTGASQGARQGEGARRNSYAGANLTYTPGASNLLEETSIADFLRALHSLHSRVGAVPDELAAKPPQRKMGTASLTPPKLSSLLALFSPPAGHSQSQQNTVTGQSSAACARRFSLMDSSVGPQQQRRPAQPRLTRRFSLRPVAAQPPHHVRQLSHAPSGTGQQESGSTEPFVLECPKRPLVQLEGVPGTSAPVAVAGATGRRFSLRPAQIGVPPAPAPAQPKPLPRWRAGMLQRQISSKQRRVRAFSLSDVHEESDRRIGISPLALHDNARTITSVQGQRLTAGKTVTIVSPSHSPTASESERQQQQQQQQQQPSSRYPFASRNFRRCTSDIESVSSRSSSLSTKTAASSSGGSSKSSSRKSSDDEFGQRPTWSVTRHDDDDDDDAWDFPPSEPQPAAPTNGEAAASGERFTVRPADVRIDMPPLLDKPPPDAQS